MPSLHQPSTRGSTTLVARVTPAHDEDPIRFLQAHLGEERALVSGPTGTMAGVGAVAVATGHGEARFQQVQAQAEALAKRLALVHADEAPTTIAPSWIGGFAFEAEDPDPIFPSARFVLPRSTLIVDRLGTHRVDIEGEPRPQPPARDTGTSASWTQHPGPEGWTLQTREALREIQAGRLDKLVLSRRLEARPAPAIDALGVAERLRDLAPESRTFLFEPVPGHAWVGASPELLIQRGGGKIQTVAMAGSRPRGASPEEERMYERSLLASSKDAWEHELVCRSIRAALDERGRPWQATLDRGVHKIAHVQHLETRFVSDTTPDEHVLGLAQRLHPTPAVSGSPREAARRLLRRLENEPRGWYGGAIGTFDAQGDGELHVALRCARLAPSSITLFAGCGIVNGSDPAEEWEESRTKFQTLLAALPKEVRP